MTDSREIYRLAPKRIHIRDAAPERGCDCILSRLICDAHNRCAVDRAEMDALSATTRVYADTAG